MSLAPRLQPVRPAGGRSAAREGRGPQGTHPVRWEVALTPYVHTDGQQYLLDAATGLMYRPPEDATRAGGTAVHHGQYGLGKEIRQQVEGQGTYPELVGRLQRPELRVVAARNPDYLHQVRTV